MATLILAVVCVVLIFVLYIASGGWKKYDGLKGIFKWVREGAGQGLGQPSSTLGRNRVREPSNEVNGAEVIQVLKDLYEEFDQKYQSLNKRIAALEAENQSLRAATTHSREFVTTLSDPAPAKDTSIDESNAQDVEEGVRDLASGDKYFKILELITLGVEPEEIAKATSVDLADVLYVQKIMGDLGPDMK